jgi:hypothetical protein
LAEKKSTWEYYHPQVDEEAACKVIIKQRMCNSSMKWSDTGAKNILILRCFNETNGKWK